jgi:hypothetical protein
MSAGCLYCGGPLPTGPKPRIFCRDKCRRKYQDARRKLERAEARAAKCRAARLMPDHFARHDLGEYERETLFGNALLDAAPIVGPGDREETLKKRAVRRAQTEKTKIRHEGKGKAKTPPTDRPVQLSLLTLPPLSKAEPLVRGRGWKKNWLTLC